MKKDTSTCTPLLKGLKTGLECLGQPKKTFNTLFYDWSLKSWSEPVPLSDAFTVSLSHIWAGDIEAGRWISNGIFTLGDHQMDHNHTVPSPDDLSPIWQDHIHGFTWLEDLRALGGDQARRIARDIVTSWLHDYKRWHPQAWDIGITGKRLSNWISLYGFYGESADEDFQDDVIAGILKQSRHLARALSSNISGIAANSKPGLSVMYAAQALIYAGLVFPGREYWLEQGLDRLQVEIRKQILDDGGHISKSPAQLLAVLKIFLNIRYALSVAEYPVPRGLENTITRTSQALRFFRYADKKLAVFHGASEQNAEHLDIVLQKANARGKILQALPSSGYERITVGRSLLMVDKGTVPPAPYDRSAHAAPMAFEFSYGRERIFVNTGTHPTNKVWQDVMRATAAHNSLSVDHRNVCEITDSGSFGRKPKKITTERQEKRDECLIEMSHDGYYPIHGITHRRRLYLGDRGHDLRGEENLTCSSGLSGGMDVMARFHLHPKIKISLIQDNKEALIQLSGGAGWRFVQEGGRLSLENSLYLGEGGQPRNTRQLVIYAPMHDDYLQLKWRLKREGLV